VKETELKKNLTAVLFFGLGCIMLLLSVGVLIYYDEAQKIHSGLVFSPSTVDFGQTCQEIKKRQRCCY
jgi:hypothetical protein